MEGRRSDAFKMLFRHNTAYLVLSFFDSFRTPIAVIAAISKYIIPPAGTGFAPGSAGGNGWADNTFANINKEIISENDLYIGFMLLKLLVYKYFLHFSLPVIVYNLHNVQAVAPHLLIHDKFLKMLLINHLCNLSDKRRICG